MKKILILCTGNSCRSQIAHGYFAYFSKDALDVYSAGIETHGVNPRAIATMEEDGIDISKHTSNHVDEYLHIPFDYILTVCDHAHEHCPYILVKQHFGFITTLLTPPNWCQKMKKKSKLLLLQQEKKSKTLHLRLCNNTDSRRCLTHNQLHRFLGTLL